MVCAKCSKLASASSTLATPTPKRKSEQSYYSGNGGAAKTTSTKAAASATAAANAGIGKSKLASKSARNPLSAMFGAACDKCKARVEQGRKFCQRCAYKSNACAMCGKSTNKTISSSGSAASPGTVQGQKFSSK